MLSRRRRIAAGVPLAVAALAATAIIAPGASAQEDPAYTCDTFIMVRSTVLGLDNCATSNGAPKSGPVQPPYNIIIQPEAGVVAMFTCSGSGLAATPLQIEGTRCTPSSSALPAR